MYLNRAQALELAVALYGADADHLARDVLVGLLLSGAAPLTDVHQAVEQGLALYAERQRRLQSRLLSGAAGAVATGDDSDRPALAT